MPLSQSDKERGDDGPEDVTSPDTSPLKRLFIAPPSTPASAKDVFESLRVVLMECVGFDPPAKGKPGKEKPPKRKGDSARRTDLTRRTAPPLATQIERLRLFYQPMLAEKYDNHVVRLRDLEQLEQVAAAYKSRSRFITELTLDPPASTSAESGP